MPIKVIITIGPNSFSAEGDFIFDDGFNESFRAWINAQQGGEDGERLDEATKRLRASTDKLRMTVSATTPT